MKEREREREREREEENRYFYGEYIFILCICPLFLALFSNLSSSRCCWISNNNTPDVPCTPNTQETHQQPSEFDLTITSPVI